MQVTVPNQHAKVIVDVAIQMEKAVNDMRSQFSKLNLGSDINRQFEGAFKNLGSTINKIMTLGGKGQLNTAEIKQLAQLSQELDSKWAGLTRRFKEFDVGNLQKISPQFKNLTLFITKIDNALAGYTQGLKKADDALAQNTEKVTKQREEQKKYESSLRNLSDQFGKVKISDPNKSFDKVNDQLKEIKVNGKSAKISLDSLLSDKQNVQKPVTYAKVWKEAYDSLKKSIEETEEELKSLEEKNVNVNKQNSLKNRLSVMNTGLTEMDKLNQIRQNQSGLKIYADWSETSKNQDKVAKSLETLTKQATSQRGSLEELSTKQARLDAILKALKQPNLEQLRKQFANLADVPLDEVPKDIDEIIKKQNEMISAAPSEFVKEISELGNKSTEQSEKSKRSLGNIIESLRQTDEATKSTNDQLDMFKSRIKYFFTAYSAVQLFKRGIQQTFETVKELDAAMTEIAVVTNFSVGDMWDQLPLYTEEANKLGVSIKSMYESTQLFYQQGLKTNQVFELGEETMKMARIAGLSQTDQTDRMTNQLRGFNMELDKTSAQKVADVYSKLAQISASNVNELSVAMTKTASIANTAGASFENTAAFIAQIVKSATYNSNVA